MRILGASRFRGVWVSPVEWWGHAGCHLSSSSPARICTTRPDAIRVSPSGWKDLGQRPNRLARAATHPRRRRLLAPSMAGNRCQCDRQRLPGPGDPALNDRAQPLPARACGRLGPEDGSDGVGGTPGVSLMHLRRLRWRTRKLLTRRRRPREQDRKNQLLGRCRGMRTPAGSTSNAPTRHLGVRHPRVRPHRRPRRPAQPRVLQDHRRNRRGPEGAARAMAAELGQCGRRGRLQPPPGSSLTDTSSTRSNTTPLFTLPASVLSAMASARWKQAC